MSAIAIDGTSATAMLVDRASGEVLAPAKLYNESQGADSVAWAKVCEDGLSCFRCTILIAKCSSAFESSELVNCTSINKSPSVQRGPLAYPEQDPIPNSEGLKPDLQPRDTLAYPEQDLVPKHENLKLVLQARDTLRKLLIELVLATDMNQVRVSSCSSW